MGFSPVTWILLKKSGFTYAHHENTLNFFVCCLGHVSVNLMWGVSRRLRACRPFLFLLRLRFHAFSTRFVLSQHSGVSRGGDECCLHVPRFSPQISSPLMSGFYLRIQWLLDEQGISYQSCCTHRKYVSVCVQSLKCQDFGKVLCTLPYWCSLLTTYAHVHLMRGWYMMALLITKMHCLSSPTTLYLIHTMPQRTRNRFKVQYVQ